MQKILRSVVAATMACCLHEHAKAIGRPFTVTDSIEMQRFVDPDLDQPVNVSPDGRHFFVVTERGVVPTGLLESTLWLFDAKAPQHPKPLVQLDGKTRWDDNNEGLATIRAARWSVD